MEKKKLELELVPADVMGVRQQAWAEFKDPIFAFTSPPVRGKLKALQKFTFCRESICEYIRSDVRKVTNMGINLTKLHLAIYRRVTRGKDNKRLKANLTVFKNQVLTAQHMANAIEKHYGWPLTKVYLLNIEKDQAEGMNPANAFYYINASKRWLKAPTMLSLYTLLFRIAPHYNKIIKPGGKIRSINSLFKRLDVLAKKTKVRDVSYYRVHGNLWRDVLDNYDKLFARRTVKEQYYPIESTSYLFSEGINRLCDFGSRDEILNEKFIKIVKQKTAK